MKKLISLLVAITLLFTLCACNNDDISDPGHHTTQAKSEGRTQGDTTTEPPASLIHNSTVVSDENLPESRNMIITGEADSKSPSGFAPLPRVSYTDYEKENTKGLSEKAVSHSHGPAAEGKPHHTVVQMQKLFDKYGAITLDEKSEGKVLYLTFDCGYEYENLTSSVLDTLKEKGVPAAFFCTLDHIKGEPELIARMIKEGHIVGNHSTTHADFSKISRSEAVKEIEDTENYLRENFGYAAKIFRFPAGAYTESVLEAISEIGYMSAFWSVAYDDWDTHNVRGKDYAVQKVMSRLHDGAVILLHSVSEDNAAALGEIIDLARAQGYEFKALTDYKKNAG